MRIIYVPLEEYECRYSLQLKEWNIREFKRLNANYVVVEGKSLDTSKAIHTGLVLDAHQRSFYALSQSQALVEMHYKGQLTRDDFILFEDHMHPGIEALAYCCQLAFHQTSDANVLPKIGVRCLAQTIDPDDFTHYTGLSSWMSHYESMVNSFIDVVFAASEEMLPFMTAAGWSIPVVVTGLPFGKQEVLERAANTLGSTLEFCYRKQRVVFASRIADEKQPEFFIAIAKEYRKRHGNDTTFIFLSGGSLSSPILDKAVIDGLVEVYPNLSKEDYYNHLATSRVLVNCSLQDWVSNTVSEADTLGCNLLFPAYRSFPEVFDNDKDRLYIPWSVDDAVDKLLPLVMHPNKRQGEISDWQDKTIERTLSAINTLDTDAPISYPDDTSYRKRIVRRALRNYVG